jgi:hypothetical protein
MDTIRHILINGTFAAIISKIALGYVDLKFFIVVVLAGALVDLDHIGPAIKTGIIKSFSRFVRHLIKIRNIHTADLYILHTYEFILLIILIGVFFNSMITLFIAIGLILHLAADSITNIKFTHGLSWIPDYSLLYMIFLK